jgi:hypothetical protein
MVDDPHREERPESPAIDARAVLLAGIGALALLAGTVAGLGAVYRTDVRADLAPAPREFPPPRLRADEAAQRERLQAGQRARLDRYAWVDRERGIVQIPIARAMALIVQEGAKAYDPVVPSPSALAAPQAGAQRATSEQGTPPANNGEAPP